MNSLTEAELVGFLELQVGSLAVKVPVRAADQVDGSVDDRASAPLASFETEGNTFAILVRGDTSSRAVERAMRDAAQVAVRHLSRKLLN
jgi:hypothetical protein